MGDPRKKFLSARGKSQKAAETDNCWLCERLKAKWSFGHGRHFAPVTKENHIRNVKTSSHISKINWGSVFIFFLFSTLGTLGFSLIFDRRRGDAFFLKKLTKLAEEREKQRGVAKIMDSKIIEGS